MKGLRTVFWAGISAILGLLTVLFVCISIPQVNQWLVYRVAENTPGLSIETVTGSLAEQLDLSGIHYKNESVKVHMQTLSIRLRWRSLIYGKIHFSQLTVQNVRYQDLGNGQKDQPTEQTEFSIPIKLHIDDLTITDIDYLQKDQKYHIKQVTSALLWSTEQLDITQLQIRYLSLQADASGQLQLTQALPFKFVCKLQGEHESLGFVASHWQLSGDKFKINFAQQSVKPVALQLQGDLLLQTQPEIHVQGDWQTLSWPLTGAEHYTSKNGHFSINGRSDDYHIKLQTQLSGMHLPESQLLLSAEGNAEQLIVKQLNLNSQQGQVKVQGTLNWQHTLHWLLDISASDVQLQTWLPDYPGLLNLHAELSGSSDKSVSTQLNILDINGTVAEFPLTGSGMLTYADESIQVQNLKIQTGDNLLQVNGVMDQQSDLQLLLDAKDLSVFDTRLQGRFNAKGQLAGDLHHPIINAQAQAQDLNFENQRIQQLDIDVLFNAQNKNALDLSAQAQHLLLEDYAIDALTIDVWGDFISHSAHLALRSAEANVKVKVTGSYKTEKQHWQGTINTLQLLATRLGDWKMLQTTDINIKHQRKSIQIDSSLLCLQQQAQHSRLCSQAEYHTDGQRWHSHLNDLALSSLATWAPKQIQMQGHLSAALNIQSGDQLKAKFSLHSDAGSLLFRATERNEQNIAFKMQLQADLSNTQLHSQFAFSSDHQTAIKSDLLINNWSDMQQSELTGQVLLNVPELSKLKVDFLPLKQMSGAINSEFFLAGSLANPYLSALTGQVKDLQFIVPDLGIAVKDMHLNAQQVAKNNYQLSGSANIDQQVLRLNGNIRHTQADTPLLQLHMQGKNLKLVQLPEAEIWLSPDVQLSWDQHGLALKGLLEVPKAHITVADIADSAVTVSKDEIIIPQVEHQQTQQQNAMSVILDVHMGNAVTIQGYGLKTRLEGDLKATYEQGRLQLFNELNLQEGVYQSYGQDLSIKKGQILFNGNIENPDVSILAFRKATDKEDPVTAYLKISGTLKQPKTSIYTLPTLPESEALAYLLTGAPLGEAGASNAALLAKAAMYLGKDYVHGVVSAIGIEEFDFKSTEVGDASMILGKRITPKLYVRYILDVVTTQMVFAVEYQLTKKISIEAKSGETHSSDIKYRFEFD